MLRASLLLLTLCGLAAAQESTPIQWAVSLAPQFDQLKDPILVIYSKARLGALVCRQDPKAGGKLLRDAFLALRDLPADAFDNSPVPLAAPSFSALAKLIQPAGKECDHEFIWSQPKLTVKLNTEWRKANTWLESALETENPERTVQLVEAALSASVPNRVAQLTTDAEVSARLQKLQAEHPNGKVAVLRNPNAIDLTEVVAVLARLSAQTPELSDDLFQKTVDFILSGPPPSPEEFAELAKYLFLPDANPRPTANLDLVVTFIQAVVRVLDNPDSVARDRDGAFDLASQMLPAARELAPNSISALQNQITALGTPGTESHREIPRSDGWLVSQIRSDIGYGSFSAARTKESRIASADVRTEVEALIRFTEAGHSLPRKAGDAALKVGIYPTASPVRALLYAGLAPAVVDTTTVLEVLYWRINDAATVPLPEQACLLPSLARAALPENPDVAAAILTDIVSALNVPGSKPGKLRCSASGPWEAVDTADGRLTFPLRVPAVDTYSLESFLSKAHAVPFGKLESAVLGLKDDLTRARALLTLAETRLKR